MVELSKEAKIIIMANAIIGSVFAFLFLVIPDIYNQMTEFEPYCQGAAMQVGTIFLTFAIFSIIAIKIDDFEKVKLYWETGIVWITLLFIVDIYQFIINPGSATAIANSVVNNVLNAVFIALNIYIFQRELKNQ